MKISVKGMWSTFQWLIKDQKWSSIISLSLSLVISISILSVIIVNRRETTTPPSLLTGPKGKLEYDLNLVASAQLGIQQWQIGDYARYRKTDLVSREVPSAPVFVDFHVIGELEESDVHRHWIKITGFRSFRHIPTASYRLVTVSDLRITPLNRTYNFTRNYVPQLVRTNQSYTPQAKLMEIGPESIQTEAGTFECILYHAVLSDDETILKVWASSKVRPLGIVRVASETEMMELVSFGEKTDITIPTLIEPVIQGISKLEGSCTSCHESESCHERIFPPK
ncbi:MAG: hypothetical protein OXN27_00870 [Candidatus Poribacteria bacterium]|nr:hypothetical protein [Candidatus Poribacteria bacterium]